jgi:uncharacterized repeat protein (TIGR01451 family)
MKERRKKALAMLLAMLLVIGLIPAPVSGALSGEGLVITGEGADAVTPLPDSLTDGAVWTDKSVTPLGNGIFNITLKALGQDYKVEEPQNREKLDVVLVLDVSGSMGSNNRIANMKVAASSAAAILLGVEGNRVAVVKYSEYATEELNFTTSSSIVANKINSFTANGGTNIQHAFYTAQRTIEQRTNSTNKPVIILMSDGEPTYYYNSVQTVTNQTNRQGNGSGSSGDHVWNTVKQAMHAKNTVNRLDIYTIGFGVSDLATAPKARATATLQPTSANTVNYRGNDAFDHKYWEDASTLSSDNAAGIFNAFVQIINQLVNYKPMSYTLNTSGDKVYSSIQIQDVLGPQFEVNGSLPTNVTQSGDVITWTLSGSDFKTLTAGSITVPQDKVNQVSFQVKIKDNTVAGGPYYTNTSASGIFTAADNNPAYPGTKAQNQVLPNKGRLSIIAPDVDVKLTINKTVTGPAMGNRTFDFGIYYDQGGTNLAYSTPVSIAVNGSGTASESVNLSLPASMFASGPAVLYVKELSSTTDPFWTYDNQGTKGVTFTRAAKEGTANFENVYAPKGTLTVKKAWSEGAPTTSVAFALEKAIEFNENHVPTKWETVSTGHNITAPNWEVSLSNLDLGVYYKVVEDPMQDYEIIYDPAYIVFDGSNLNKMITITNKYQTPKGKITLNKVWEDNNNGAGDRPDQIVFDYTGPTSGQLVLTKDGGWTNSLETTAFGTYTFTEAVPQDYKASESALNATISQEPLGARETSLTFTNTYVVPKGKLTVSKEWKDDNGKEIYRPGFIKIQLFKSEATTDDQGNSTDSAVAVGGEVELNASNQWKYDFTDLMFGKYWVEEITTVPDYTTTYSALEVSLEKGIAGNISKRTGGITITNTFTNPKGEITVKKNWIETDVDEDQVRPDEITVTLMKGTESVGTATLSALNGWGTSFKNLELDGSVYTVTESATKSDDAAKLANYKQTIVYGGNGGSEAGMTIDKNKRIATATLTNTYAKGTITVTKNWVDKNNPTTEQPDEATITLYKVVKTIIEENVTEILTGENGTTTEAIVGTTTREAIDRTIVGTRTLDRSTSPASLTTVFYDLEMGENISYEVMEDSIPFYDTEYSEQALTLTAEEPNGSVTVTNTYTDPKGSLTVYKEWMHGYNPNKATEFTIQLFKNGNKVDEKTGNGEYVTFNNLDLNAEYTVQEKKIDNYASSGLAGFKYTPVKGAATVEAGSVTVTNTYVPEVGSLQVNKKWVGTTGEAITVTLYRTSGTVQDTQFSKTETLNENNNWQHTFDGLELYGPNGLYSYEARETGNLGLYDPTNNETPTLTAGKTATITITNTYSPEAKGTLIIQKKWLDTEGQEIAAPVESIEVFLKINGTEEESAMVLNADNQWTVTRTGLNADPSIKYTVREAGSPEEFEVTVIGDGSFTSQNLTKTITITNTMTANDPKLEVTKQATKDTGFLEDGKATFTYTVTLKNTGNRTLGNLYILDDMVPTGAALGGDITYNPAPTPTENGKVRFDLPEGTLAPGKSTTFTYTVTVDKAGTYDNTATAYGSYKNTSVSGEDSESVLVKEPGLSILKTVIGPATITGYSGTFTYQITVKNDGEVDLANVKVKDVMTLVPNSTAVYSFGGTGNIIFDEGTKTFTIGALTAGSEEKIIFTYTVNLNQPGTYNNTATVTGEYTDTVTGEEGPEEIQKQLTDSDSAQVRIVPPTRPNPPGGPSDPQPPVDIPDEDTPLTENLIDNPDIIIPEEDVPLGEMPQTGGVPAALFFGLGALAAGSGLWLRRKEKGEKNLDQ